ncbi:consortin [Xiphophorus maculatus]|uniref:Consortin, connexin sorting protein n=1 Tax=Xiphophorus maculatus TaxID=8083 RepID=A0A3B5QEY5_XIPMA|nr:consortin [Xiphophorus maculatus]XP_023188271.1 consortin [Xiphophorus maculatus]
MDHGLFEMEGNAISQVHVDVFDLCDNLSNSEALTAQTQNLNETLAQTLPLPQNDEGGTCSLVQKPSPDNNEKEEETGIGGYSLGSRDVDQEEDVDEVMKEEEEDESEASSSLICCQSPDNLMTDSSYSETGSLLETPFPFSPGTSPEPASPVIPIISPETLHPINSLELSQSGEEVISYSASSGLDSAAVESAICSQTATFSTESVGVTSDTQLDGSSGTRCNTVASDATLKDSCPEQLTSSKDPVSNCGPALTGVTSSSSTGPVTNREPYVCTTGSHTTAMSSNQEQFTSSPVADYSSVSTSSTGSALSPTLLASLEQMAERDDDAHLPQYLHQIAEAFVLQKDYQRALLFIQLEQLYHQRVLENLNALQQQWVSHCGGASPELAATHLDSLKHICQTHSSPRTRDAQVALLDNLSLQFGGGVSRPSCISAHQVKGRMEQRDEDSSCPPVLSDNLIKRLSSPEMDRKPPNGNSQRTSYGSDQTRRQADGREAKGGGERAASTRGNGLHPSAAERMDRSSPAEQLEEDLGPAREAEAKEEEEEEEDGSEVEEAAEALEMEDEGTEDDDEEKQSELDFLLSQEAPTVETLVSGAELQLHSEKLHLYQDTQEDSESCLSEEALPSQEADLEQQEQYPEEREEEEDYDFIRRAPSLDEMAKLITVEEMSPAAGLVSILKKQSVYVDSLTTSADPEPARDKPTAKRRVRFKVSDDTFDHEVGGGDSCLLLFLLCLVTVVISVGGTALYCALGDAQSSVCQDFSRNADFYFGQIRRGITRLQHWYSSGL